MRNILFILAALVGFGAFGQTNVPTRQMMADTNGVVKWPTNITRIRIGGTDYTNLLGFGLSITNGQLSVDTTQLPAGGGGGGSGTVTSVGLDLPSQLSVSGTPVTGSGTLTGAWVNQAANRIFAGPTTGADAAPTFRAMVDADVPNDITIDLAAVATVANSGDSATSFFSSGTIDAARIDSAIARLASPAFTGSPTAPTASPGTSNTVVATTAFVLQNAGPGGGGDVYLGNSQTFTGTNTFTGPVTISGPLTISTQTVDVLNIGSLGLGTNIIGLANGGTSATNAAGARAALGTDNADNITSGTVADARIASSIARDSEVSATYAPLASPALTGSPTVPTASAASSNTVAASTAYVDRAVALGGGGGGGSDTNWNGTPIASGTITNLKTESITLNGLTQTNWLARRNRIYASTDFLVGIATASAAYAGTEWSGGATASGTATRPSLTVNGDSSWAQASSSSSANSGYYWVTAAAVLRLDSSFWTEFSIRTEATNNTVILSKIGFVDTTGITTPVDGLYWNRDGMTVNLVARSNNVSTVSPSSFTVYSNSVHFCRIGTVTNGADYISYMHIWNSNSPPTLLTTLLLTNGLPIGRDTGHGYFGASTNNVAVNLDSIGFMSFEGYTGR